jgi:uncharacterized protein
MIIELARVTAAGRRFEGDEPPEILDVAPAEDVRPAGPIHYNVLARKVSGQLLVTGSLAVDMAFRCSRCAEGFSRRILAPDFDCAAEIAAEAESVDLTGEIRETILLALPNYPVCRDECKGLCAQCGANLNRGPCGCRSRTDDRWGALDRLQSAL